MKSNIKTVKVEAKTACFVNNEPCFTGIKEDLELSVGDIRNAIFQNANVYEKVSSEYVKLNLDNYDKKLSEDDVEEELSKPDALILDNLTITNNSITCNKSLNSGESMVVYTKGSIESPIGTGNTVNSLTAYTEYDVYVKITKDDDSMLSDKLTVRTKDDDPTKPSKLIESNLSITNTQITCNKNLNSNEKMVVFTKGSTSDMKGEAVKGTPVKGLTAYTEYDVYIRATNRDNKSVLSDKLTVRTKDNDPTKPATLTFGDLTVGQTEITCTKSLASDEKMEVYTDGSISDKKGEGTKGVPVSGLAASTPYDVYVKKTNRDNKSVLSDKFDVTTTE